MGATPYFLYPWGSVGGDLLAIPATTQSDGSVSYQQGFGPDYSLPLSNPSAFPVPRTSTNQLYNDVTVALQQYQQIGTPNFITTSQNGGSPFSYAQYSTCIYDDGTNGPRVFESTINSNTGLPSAASTPFTTAGWRWNDSNANKIIFDNVTFDSSVTQGMAVYLNGAIFFPAVDNGTTAQNVVGFADKNFGRVYGTASMCGIIPLSMTAGTPYYLSSVTPGAISATPSTVFLGTAIATNTLMVNVQLLPFVSPAQNIISSEILGVTASPLQFVSAGIQNYNTLILQFNNVIFSGSSLNMSLGADITNSGPTYPLSGTNFLTQGAAGNTTYCSVMTGAPVQLDGGGSAAMLGGVAYNGTITISNSDVPGVREFRGTLVTTGSIPASFTFNGFFSSSTTIKALELVLSGGQTFTSGTINLLGV